MSSLAADFIYYMYQTLSESASFCKRYDKNIFFVFFRFTVLTAVHLQNTNAKFHKVEQRRLHFCMANLLRTICTKFYSNWSGFVDCISKSMSVCFFLVHSVESKQQCKVKYWATSLFGLVFRSVFHSVQNSDWAKVKPKSEVDFFVRTQSEVRTERKTELIVWSEVRSESKVNLNYSDSVQMNLHARDRLISYRLTFAEWKTTSLFRLVQTNRIAKKSDLSPRRNHY